MDALQNSCCTGGKRLSKMGPNARHAEQFPAMQRKRAFTAGDWHENGGDRGFCSNLGRQSAQSASARQRAFRSPQGASSAARPQLRQS
jgi:hypothetical protein